MSYSFASNSNLRGAQRGAAQSTATTSFVGVVRVDGNTMQVDANGTISVDPQITNNLSSNLQTLSSNTWRAATSSTLGLVKADGTSIAVNNGVITSLFTWNVVDVNSTVASGATGSYSFPANTIMVMGTAYHGMGGNSGSRVSVNIKSSDGTTLYTYVLTGGNEGNGGDGGSGMSSRSAFSIAIPAAAAGGSLEFFRSSGSNNGWNVTVNQIVKNTA